MNWLHVYLKLVIDSHVAPLSQQHRQLFTTDLKSVSWMCFSKWLVLTDHYGWRRKRGLVKYMCQNCFSFCFIKKCLGAVFVLTSTSWHLYYIMVHGSFWGCLEQMYQPVQFLNPFLSPHCSLQVCTENKVLSAPDVSSSCNISKKGRSKYSVVLISHTFAC